MSSDKRKTRRLLWMLFHSDIEMPPSTTKEGHAVYMKTQRQFDRNLNREMSQHSASLHQLLFNIEWNKQRIAKLLDLEVYLTKKKMQR